MSRLVRPEGRTNRLAPAPTPAVRSLNRSMTLPIGGLIKKILQELLKILDKIFGGMPHEAPQ